MAVPICTAIFIKREFPLRGLYSLKFKKMKEGKITGWNFKMGYNADGESTLETLTAEKKRLEARIVQIPKTIAQLNHSITITQNDINWLNSLSSRRKKKWAEENGKSVEQAIALANRKVVEMKGQISSMTAEKSRIPEQIKSIQRQLDSLVKGESTGLEKGIDKETAKELGELELQKERDKMAHENNLREAELAAQKIELEQKQTTGDNKTKWLIGAGIVLLITVVGWIVYKKQLANKIVVK